MRRGIPSASPLGLALGAVLAGLVAASCRDEPRAPAQTAPEAKPVPRVVIIGVDGLDPGIVAELVARDALPNLARLHREPLAAPLPSHPLSAWTSLFTGRDASAHGVTGAPPHLGADGPPLRGAAEWLWETLARSGRRVRVIRAPAAFPAERRANLELLAGEGSPDVLGGPCRWLVVSSGPASGVSPPGAAARAIEKEEPGRWRADITLERPDGTTATARLSFATDGDGGDGPVLVARGRGGEVRSPVGRWSDWLSIGFTDGPAEVEAVTRMLPLEIDGALEVFLSPPFVDPFAPELPITYPRYWAGFLADRYGRYRGCSAGGDETAFAAGVIGPGAFLRQAYGSWEQQERMTLGEMTRDGWDVLVSVFPQPGPAVRVFERASDPGMPCHDAALADGYGDTVERMYGHLDSMVGEILKALGPSDRLIVVSARGLRTVRRELNVTSWLREEGYLVLDRSARQARVAGLDDVDWSKTRAYGLGAGGIYLNLAGREPGGIVEPGEEASALLEEIRGELAGLSEGSRPVVEEVRTAEELLGEHAGRGPDLLVVLAPGYAVSAASSRGSVPRAVLQDSSRPWIPAADGGDPDDAAGVLMTVLPPAGTPAMEDLVPTVLEVQGVPAPPDLPGTSFW